MLLVRLACVKPAASVRSEPGSNSQVEERMIGWSHDSLTRKFGSDEPKNLCSLRNVFRRSLVMTRPGNRGRVRKDSAVHVSLSSYSVFKEPGQNTPARGAKLTTVQRAERPKKSVFPFGREETLPPDLSESKAPESEAGWPAPLGAWRRI